MALKTESTEQIAKAIGRIPSGCAIMTAKAGERAMGMLASWVQQAAFEPPMITVAVKKERAIVDLVDASGRFALNLLGEDPTAMFKHFGKGFAPDEDAFAGLDTETVEGGIAIADRIACLSVAVRHKQDAGDHWLYIAEVTTASTGGDLQKPYVHIRKNGMSY